MNPVLFASFIALILIITFSIRNQAKQAKQKEEDFWSREHRANFVRCKPLDHLKYVKIPLESFPTHLLNDDPRVLECIEVLETLTSRKIVNFTGYSNTDLKLEYGTANLETLTECDQNYTLLVRTLQKWADVLLEAGCDGDAATLMEFAVSIETDVSRTYYLLADYLVSHGQAAQVDRLVRTAENLRSANRDSILKNLREKYPAVF